MALAKSVYERLGQSALSTPGQTARRHVVRARETLPAIAAYEYPGTGYNAELWRQIGEANAIDDPETQLTAGVVLSVPQPAASST